MDDEGFLSRHLLLRVIRSAFLSLATRANNDVLCTHHECSRARTPSPGCADARPVWDSGHQNPSLAETRGRPRAIANRLRRYASCPRRVDPVL